MIRWILSFLSRIFCRQKKPELSLDRTRAIQEERESSNLKNLDQFTMKAPLGQIEPHAPLLKVPPDDQALFKAMSLENFLRCLDHNYLHFNRVDRYADFPDADCHDGEIPPKDRQAANGSRFVNAPDYSASNYYDNSRLRTYACCFSLENTAKLWTYGNVCIVLHFGRLRKYLNEAYQSSESYLEYNGERLRKIFDLNYGLVNYVDWKEVQLRKERRPNPIEYIYYKDLQYSDDKELRVSLSAIGMGKFCMNDGKEVCFTDSLTFNFDLRKAVSEGVIQYYIAQDSQTFDWLRTELAKRNIDIDPPDRP